MDHGEGRRRVRVALAGVGNNASAVVQGVHHYGTPEGRAAADRRDHGIRFAELCGYRIADLSFSCAFDVDERKIDLDLGEAVLREPNCYPEVLGEPVLTGATVHPAPVLDGVPTFLTDMVAVSPRSQQQARGGDFERCTHVVRETGTDVLVNFLPSGSHQATLFFARMAAAAGAAYVNCTATPAAHSPEIVELFERAGTPLLGDDLEGQFGSSLIHRTVLEALEQRGLQLVHSYQVNLGGNADFKNLYHRPDAKRASKRMALSTTYAADQVDVIPSAGFVNGLRDNKVGYITIEGRGWLDMPVTVDVKLKVQDSSNAAGMTVDLIRLAAGARDRNLAGYVHLPYYFKSPLGRKPPTAEALAMIERLDRGEWP